MVPYCTFHEQMDKHGASVASLPVSSAVNAMKHLDPETRTVLHCVSYIMRTVLKLHYLVRSRCHDVPDGKTVLLSYYTSTSFRQCNVFQMFEITSKHRCKRRCFNVIEATWCGETFRFRILSSVGEI